MKIVLSAVLFLAAGGSANSIEPGSKEAYSFTCTTDNSCDSTGHYINRKIDNLWSDAVKQLEIKSGNQNNGEADFKKLCNTFCYYTTYLVDSKGNHAFIQEIHNLKANLVRRLYCTMGKSLETRDCRNFDNGLKFQDAYINGKWARVSGSDLQ